MNKSRPSQGLRDFLSAFLEGSGPGPRADWRRPFTAAPAATALLLASACGGGDLTADSVGEGDCSGGECAAECSDGLDNDGDGRIDCADPDCDAACGAGTGGTGGSDGASGGTAGTGGVTGGTAGTAGTGGVTGGTAGTGGVMDGTGGVTGGTGGVTGGTGGYAGGLLYGVPYEVCDNEYDDDFDGLTDCEDPSCQASAACAVIGGAGGEAGAGGTGGLLGGYGGVTTAYGIPYEVDCTNGFDDDGDGAADCDDSDCYSSSFCSAPEYGIPIEEDCTDGVDNNGDGRVDCDDPGCTLASSCLERYGIPY